MKIINKRVIGIICLEREKSCSSIILVRNKDFYFMETNFHLIVY